MRWQLVEDLIWSERYSLAGLSGLICFSTITQTSVKLETKLQRLKLLCEFKDTKQTHDIVSL